VTQRTSRETVTFQRPFVLGRLDEVFPAGAYLVETDEAFIEGISFPVFRRTATLFHVHALADAPGITRTIEISPRDLDEALKRDQAPASFAGAARPA
jgi:hypothetical protein